MSACHLGSAYLLCTLLTLCWFSLLKLMIDELIVCFLRLADLPDPGWPDGKVDALAFRMIIQSAVSKATTYVDWLWRLLECSQHMCGFIVHWLNLLYVWQSVTKMGHKMSHFVLAVTSIYSVIFSSSTWDGRTEITTQSMLITLLAR